MFKARIPPSLGGGGGQRNPQKEKATDYFKLVLQAKNYLEGEKKNKRLLKNDELVESYLGDLFKN
ncbi:hypothetical protein C9439_02755 [archaeon SCG-AAA382B04]|nr:hypothetical protein C9439_02755 [archaeon SCG-AAA382B04]